MSKRVAVITGATSDIGAAIAQALAREGSDVAVHFHSRGAAAESLVAELREIGVRAAPFAGDIGRLDDVRAMAAAIESELGSPTILVNVAAAVRFERFFASDPDDWQAQIDTTLIGTMNAARVFGEPMIAAERGRIVSIVAEGALVGEPALAVASVAKAGVLGLTRTLAKELAPRGVTVNAVAPGFVPTSSVPERFMTPERLAAVAKSYPMGRLGRPEEIAAAVAYLCSDGAGYVTGQTLSVSGGYSVR